MVRSDNPPHDIWMESRESQIASTQYLVDKLKAAFPKTPVFPTLGASPLLPPTLAYPTLLIVCCTFAGNHESFPVDQVSVIAQGPVCMLLPITTFPLFVWPVPYAAQEQLVDEPRCEDVVLLASFRRSANRAVQNPLKFAALKHVADKLLTTLATFFQIWRILHHTHPSRTAPDLAEHPILRHQQLLCAQHISVPTEPLSDSAADHCCLFHTLFSSF
jgi:hypothetical protein